MKKPTHSFMNGDPGLLFEGKILGLCSADFDSDAMATAIPLEEDKVAALIRLSDSDTQWRLKWNVLNPATAIATDLFLSVKSSLEKLGLNDPNLKMCFSIATSLDRKHHTDCYFILKYRTEIFYVTIDLTLSIEGAHESKRDTENHIVLRPKNLGDFFERSNTGSIIAHKLWLQLQKDRR